MLLQKIIKAMLFPTRHIKGDWYRSKGYESFDDYLNKQRSSPNQPLHSILNDVDIKQTSITSYSTRGRSNTLEGIEIKMKEVVDSLPYDQNTLACKGKHIVAFLGRSEYYQYDLRDLAIEACKTGATVHGFNYSGMYASTGEAKCFDDLVNDGFAVVHKLIKENGIHPNDIILQGNCLGSAVAEAVNRKIHTEFGFQMRQINSNSFKSIKAVIIHSYPFLEKFKTLVKKILRYTGWEIKPGKLGFKETSQYSCYMHREGDKTIGNDAKIHNKIEKHKESQKECGEYENTRQKLTDLSEMVEAKDWAQDTWKQHYKTEWLPKNKNGEIVSGTKYDDAHELHLYQLHTKKSDNQITTMFDFINTYVKESEKFIESREAVTEKVKYQTTNLDKMSQNLIPKERIVFSDNEKKEIKEIIEHVCEVEIGKSRLLINDYFDPKESQNKAKNVVQALDDAQTQQVML